MKSIFTIHPAIRENMEDSLEIHALYLNIWNS